MKTADKHVNNELTLGRKGGGGGVVLTGAMFFFSVSFAAFSLSFFMTCSLFAFTNNLASPLV